MAFRLKCETDLRSLHKQHSAKSRLENKPAFLSLSSHVTIPQPLENYQNIKKRIAQRQFFKSCRHQPIFPVRRQTSIFGTCELNFCVRYGNRWTLAVIDTYYEIGDPYGNRTHVCGVRGRRLNRLTNGPGCISRLAP